MNNFNLETERLSIRRFLPADGSDLAEILTDYETVFYEPYEPFSEHQAFAEAEKFSQDTISMKWLSGQGSYTMNWQKSIKSGDLKEVRALR